MPKSSGSKSKGLGIIYISFDGSSRALLAGQTLGATVWRRYTPRSRGLEKVGRPGAHQCLAAERVGMLVDNPVLN